MNMSACTLFNEQNKAPNVLSIAIWSELGKQNVQVNKVYWSRERRYGKVWNGRKLSQFLKCHRDKKINSYFSLDFKTMLTKH